jgi:hypothetical protein
MVKNKALIIHHDGNLNHNPFLASLKHILSPKYEIEYRCTFRNIEISGVKVKKANIITYRLVHKLIAQLPFILYPLRLLSCFFSVNTADIIISVDREGAIDSYLLNTKPGCKRIHISFEIMFKEETSNRFKAAEIVALEKSEIIIIQDRIRAELFSCENKINMNKIKIVPLVYYDKKHKTLRRIRDEVKIPEHHQVILWQGSLRKWNGIEKFYKLIENLPKNHSILVHGRDRVEVEHFRSLFSDTKNVFYSDVEYKDVLNMQSLFEGISWGIVFYQMQKNNRYTGLNIQEIGHASGKFGNFMRHGIPVIYDGCGQFLTYEIENNKIGMHFDKFLEKAEFIEGEALINYQRRCQNYYDKKLKAEKLEKLIATLF